MIFGPRPDRFQGRGKGEQKVAEKLRVRPYRFWEVVWDCAPCPFILISFFDWFMNRSVTAGEHMVPQTATALVEHAIISAFVGGIWMQFAANSTLRQVCGRDWRESLTLTEIDERAYLVSQLRPRIVVQGIIFLIGIALCLCALVAGGIWLHYQSLMLERFSWSEFLLLLSLLYVAATSLVCGFSGGLLGGMSRIRKLCREGEGRAILFLTQLKWCAIMIVVFLLFFLGAFLIILSMFWQESESRGPIAIFIATITFVICTFFNSVCASSIRLTWKDTGKAFRNLD